VILEDSDTQHDRSLANGKVANALAIALLVTLLLKRPTMRTNRRRDFRNERELQRLPRPVLDLMNDLEVVQRQDLAPPFQLLLL
jgi:hypothetical protein